MLLEPSLTEVARQESVYACRYVRIQGNRTLLLDIARMPVFPGRTFYACRFVFVIYRDKATHEHTYLRLHVKQLVPTGPGAGLCGVNMGSCGWEVIYRAIYIYIMSKHGNSFGTATE